MANFWNGIIRRIRKSLYMQPIQAKLRLDSIYHNKGEILSAAMRMSLLGNNLNAGVQGRRRLCEQ